MFQFNIVLGIVMAFASNALLPGSWEGRMRGAGCSVLPVPSVVYR
jgi:hypothetical protein